MLTLEAMLGDANKAELLASVRAIVPSQVRVLEAIQEQATGPRTRGIVRP